MSPLSDVPGVVVLVNSVAAVVGGLYIATGSVTVPAIAAVSAMGMVSIPLAAALLGSRRPPVEGGAQD